jgi:hypothetical protein
MTVGQIIIVTVWLGMFFLGYKSGHANGYVEGRKAVRYYYEKLERQHPQVKR